MRHVSESMHRKHRKPRPVRDHRPVRVGGTCESHLLLPSGCTDSNLRSLQRDDNLVRFLDRVPVRGIRKLRSADNRILRNCHEYWVDNPDSAGDNGAARLLAYRDRANLCSELRSVCSLPSRRDEQRIGYRIMLRLPRVVRFDRCDYSVRSHHSDRSDRQGRNGLLLNDSASSRCMYHSRITRHVPSLDAGSMPSVGRNVARSRKYV